MCFGILGNVPVFVPGEDESRYIAQVIPDERHDVGVVQTEPTFDLRFDGLGENTIIRRRNIKYEAKTDVVGSSVVVHSQRITFNDSSIPEIFHTDLQSGALGTILREDRENLLW